MLRAVTIVLVIAVGLSFGQWLSLAILTDILQPIIVGLSIMAAALLVRLNRGMPALDWKSLEANERKLLTEKVVALTREYMVVLTLHGVTLVTLLILATQRNAVPWVHAWVRFAILFALGALLTLCVARMAYIVWRDYDIVRLQKKLIDEGADREAVEKASQEALTKVTAIRASGLRAGQKVEPSGWKD